MRRREKSIKKLAECNLSTKVGEFTMYVYGDREGKEHVALVKGEIENGENLPCRVHSSCLTGEVFHGTACPCHEQLTRAMKICQNEGKGIIVYLSQQGGGRGISALAKQMKSARFGIDKRNYQIAAEILRDLKVKSIRLMTENPQKVEQLKRWGIKVVGTISC